MAMTLTSLVSLTLLQQNLRNQVDTELLVRGKATAQQAFATFNQEAERNLLLSDYYVVYTGLDGSDPYPVCARSQDAQECPKAPALPTLTSAYVTAHEGHPFTVADSDDGDPWRVLVFPARVEGTDRGVNIAVALPLTGTTRTVSDFRTIAFAVSAGVLVLGAFFAVLAIRRSFRPLDDIERTASAIAGGDLSQRVPDAPASTEIGRLSTALNTMLSQIETSFRAQERSEEQMRRFVADASHELRTPLAAIRGFAELYRQGAVREPDDVAHVMGRIEGESTRLGRLVEDLLALARLDEAQRARTARREPVDLVVVASDAVHDARALAPDRTVRLTGLRPDEGPGSAVVVADEAGMRQVLTNLLANAVHHTPRGRPSRSRSAGPRARRGRSASSRCATTVPGSPPTRRTRCSSGSTASTPRAAAARVGAPGWAWPSSRRSSTCTAGPSPCCPPRAAARPSGCASARPPRSGGRPGRRRGRRRRPRRPDSQLGSSHLRVHLQRSVRTSRSRRTTRDATRRGEQRMNGPQRPTTDGTGHPTSGALSTQARGGDGQGFGGYGRPDDTAPPSRSSRGTGTRVPTGSRPTAPTAATASRTRGPRPVAPPLPAVAVTTTAAAGAVAGADRAAPPAGSGSPGSRSPAPSWPAS